MPYEIVPVSPADADAIATGGSWAFRNDGLQLAAFPPHLVDPANPHEEREWRLARFRKRYCAGTFWCKVVDPDDGSRIVGVAGWAAPKHGADANDTGADISSPRCANKEVLDGVRAKINEARDRILGRDSNVWYLMSLFTSPEFQGKGIGARLVRWGLARAEEDGVPVYLEATPAGQPLYRKLGFEVVGEVDLAPLLPEGVEYRMLVMMKHPPQSKRG